jgi:hypothetical protein
MISNIATHIPRVVIDLPTYRRLHSTHSTVINHVSFTEIKNFVFCIFAFVVQALLSLGLGRFVLDCPLILYLFVLFYLHHRKKVNSYGFGFDRK